MGRFHAAQILPLALYRQITDVRVSDPDRSLRAARRRRRRAELAPDGRLNIVAADHPARGVLAVGENPIRMGNRHDYLARVLRILSSDLIDGVMATMDVLEDLLVIHDLLLERGGRGILDQKLLIASLNRGGVAGAIWEMDDPMTGPSPQNCVDWNLDGAKILLRLCPDDSGSLKTLVAAANAITSANALSLPTFLEPLPVVKSAAGFQVQQSKVPLVSAASIASALGDSSRNLWLKLPYCAEYEAVAAATSLPILILGGQSATEPTRFLTQVADAMAAGANVRGALVGRNLLYPEHEDPLMLAEAVGAIVHKGCTVEQALDAARASGAGVAASLLLSEGR
jgi:hypothetical protein